MEGTQIDCTFYRLTGCHSKMSFVIKKCNQFYWDFLPHHKIGKFPDFQKIKFTTNIFKNLYEAYERFGLMTLTLI